MNQDRPKREPWRIIAAALGISALAGMSGLTLGFVAWLVQGGDAGHPLPLPWLWDLASWMVVTVAVSAPIVGVVIAMNE